MISQYNITTVFVTCELQASSLTKDDTLNYHI